MSHIVLSTINARYIHASLGLRYLYANMGSLSSSTRLLEFTLENRAEDIAETLLQEEIKIIGFGVYIWNITQTTEVIRLIKIVRPDIRIIAGGPEISFEHADQAITRLVDHLIAGQADVAFAQLCQQILNGENAPKIITPLPIDLNELASPYPHYSDEDISNRVLYVEASRGCPFKCEFCLSSLDKTAVPFALDDFITQMRLLIDRGARHFKFVDRTFNLKVESCRQMLEFFLEHMEKGLFLHFELIPDRLPATLRDLLPRFPAGSLQFEIGIQSFNTEVQQLISRKQHHAKTCENLRWLREHTSAHVHTDLIFGLPGENLESFASGFNLLYSLGPQEIQVGILKRLRGTPISRHTRDFDMRYMSVPPYRILMNRDVGFCTMQRMVRFARYWDLIGNSGRFPATLPLLLGDQPFQRFMLVCEWLFQHTGQTHKFALVKLFELLWQAMIEVLEVDQLSVESSLASDFNHNQLKGRPKFLLHDKPKNNTTTHTIAKRQHRHIIQ